MWKCAKCGEEMDDQFTECWACAGANLSGEEKESFLPAHEWKKKEGIFVRVISCILAFVGVAFFSFTIFMSVSAIRASGWQWLGADSLIGIIICSIIGIAPMFVAYIMSRGWILYIGGSLIISSLLLIIQRPFYIQMAANGHIDSKYGFALAATVLPFSFFLLIAGVVILVVRKLRSNATTN